MAGASLTYAADACLVIHGAWVADKQTFELCKLATKRLVGSYTTWTHTLCRPYTIHRLLRHTAALLATAPLYPLQPRPEAQR